MNTKELTKTESFLNGRSRTAKLRDSIRVQHIKRVEWTTGGYALEVRYGIPTKDGEYQNQALIASFDQAVMKFGAENEPAH